MNNSGNRFNLTDSEYSSGFWNSMRFIPGNGTAMNKDLASDTGSYYLQVQSFPDLM